MKHDRKINNISFNSFLAAPVILLLFIIIIPISSFGGNQSVKGLTTIIIDAGHGGKDPGAVVGNAVEKNIVLDIALRLGTMVKKEMPDLKVIYTRKGDYFVPLFKRSEIANENNANLFISIHANYCESPSIKGTETYVLGLHRTQDNLEVAKKENSVILLEEDYTKRYEGFDPNSPESYIMFELIQDNHIEQSVLFAGMVQDLFQQQAGRPNRDVRQAGFLVLRETAMPSVLIETGYLSNKTEAAYLMTQNGRESIASAIFRSLQNYKSRFESRLNIPEGEIKPITADASRKSASKTISKTENLSKATSEGALIGEKSLKETPNEGIKSKSGDSDQKINKDNIIPVKNPEITSGKDSLRSKNSDGNNKGEKDKNPAVTQKENVIARNTIPVKEVLKSGKNETAVSAVRKDAPEKINNKIISENIKTQPPVSDTGDTYTFAVQIAASKTKLPKTFSLFKGIDNIREVQIAGYYKYYILETSSRSKASANLMLTRQKIPDAFIVGMKNGTPVPLKEVPNKAH